MPATSVTENARSFPSRPASVPLADSTSAPTAMRTFPSANNFGRIADRRALLVTAGTRPRTTRPADHKAPAMMTTAGTPDPTPARMRGTAPNSSFAVGNSDGSTVRRIGAVQTIPMA